MKPWRYMIGAFVGLVLFALWVPFSIEFLPKVWWSWSVSVIVGVLFLGVPAVLGGWWSMHDD